MYQQDQGYHQGYQDSQVPYNQFGQQQSIPQQVPQFNRPGESMQHQHQAAHQIAHPVQTQRIPEPEKPKAPIPEEHIHLKTVLDELKAQCYETAKNPVRTASSKETKILR